ncbi:MAG: hypothetical protein CL666_04425 [Balneola sp.]|nr:hypothetical protein [Balneola sp.]|tara:strand:- start:57611 stop:59389 length:1779 start_codon:yes stop_codon:yes gene_type:complete
MNRLKISLLTLISVFLGVNDISLAQESITFPAKDLQLISQRYTGSQINWPLILEMATHESETNTFTLASADVLKLQNFSNLAASVSTQKVRIQELIGSGATIFAPQELAKVTRMTDEYQQRIKEGDLETAATLADQLPLAVDELEKILMDNRLVDVQAQISKKTGEVDKRLGLLGSWQEADQGDLLKELDGLRTMIESFANLDFTDGSTVIIEPETEAIIRRSRIDKLNESTDTEITLENGSLLAKLSASGKSKSKYILNAGPSQSELRSQNFYAEAEGPGIARLTNYEGAAVVKANDVSITIQKNEGTIVEEGKDPLPPVQLLPAPGLAWGSTDSVIYRTSVVFPFIEVDRAREYRVQFSPNPNFNEKVTSIITTQTSVTLQDLPLGTTYVRVQASDELGLKGPHSETTRIIRNIDNKPPPLFIDKTRNDLLFTLQNAITLSGVTEPNVQLLVDDEPQKISASGQFSIKKTDLENDQILSLKAEDRSGNITDKEIRIIKLTEAVLYNLSLQGARGTNTIEVQREEITISGNAYPGLEVEATLMDFRRTIKTDSRGRWGITFTPKAGNLVITFKNAYSGQTYLTKTYTVHIN